VTVPEGKSLLTFGNLDRVRIARMFAVFYFTGLCAILLYPFHHLALFPMIANTAEHHFDGLYFGASGMLRSIGPSTALYERLRSAKGLTLEIWLTSAAADQDKARIFSYSLDPWHRNFTLAQEENGTLNIRLRTTRTDSNGINPDLRIPGVLRPGVSQHVVVTYDLDWQRIYIDGGEMAVVAVPGGDFRNWDPACFLVFGNEATGARPWNGKIAFAAIYDKPLIADTVFAHYEAGWASQKSFADDGPVFALKFVETLHGPDAEGTGPTLAILSFEEPKNISADSRLIFSLFEGADRRMRVSGDAPVLDVIGNIVLFIPFGLGLYWALGRKPSLRASALLTTVLLGVFLSAGFEAVQVFLPGRTSSIYDVIANTTGTLCGALLASFFPRQLVRELFMVLLSPLPQGRPPKRWKA
jgi:hypothetical protein